MRGGRESHQSHIPVAVVGEGRADCGEGSRWGRLVGCWPMMVEVMAVGGRGMAKMWEGRSGREEMATCCCCWCRGGSADGSSSSSSRSEPDEEGEEGLGQADGQGGGRRSLVSAVVADSEGAM